MNEEHSDDAPPDIGGMIGTARALFQSGRLAEAAGVLGHVLDTEPENLDALYLLGTVAFHGQVFPLAVKCLGKALTIGPPVPEAFFGLAAALEKLGRLDEAAIHYTSALRARPIFPEALAKLGVVLYRLGRRDEGIGCLEDAVRQRPNDAETVSNLGLMLFETGRLDEAAERYADALRLNPALPEALTNLGNVLQHRGELDDAFLCQRAAVCLQPALASALSNLGGNFLERGHPEDALSCFLRAQRADPAFAGSEWNEGMARLVLGDLDVGWEKYELRWLAGDEARGSRAGGTLNGRQFRQPRWDGVSDLSGKRLLLWREQGVGDEILFASCFPDLERLGAHITYEGSPKLRALFARSFPHMRITVEDAGADLTRDDIDVHLPIGSLPRLFRRTLADFPDHRGFLRPDPARVAHWRNRLEAIGPGPYVGLHWRGGTRVQARSHYYTRIEDWEAVLRLSGLTFINMQYSDATEEVSLARDRFGVDIHTFDDIDMWNDLDDVAALLKALDVQLAVSTSVHALAGAVGVPTWLLIARKVGWTCLGTEGLPWYPSMRMAARGPDESWRTPIERVAAALAGMVASRRNHQR
ncbi:MAG TPA: tetratricopeptide repeat protein [Caulobacteraceae bacterium]|nr:tetratricopeptide repeat protein [Caulobacteraceae bacterium]